jgi:diguanylate cyclase (GGDEF)-like protein
VARTLTGSLRPADIVGRWGGDEFLAIVHNVNGRILKALVERCIALVAQTSFPGRDRSSITLSLSVGSVLARPGATAEKLIQQADEWMYRSKTNGRMRTRQS